MPAIFLNIEIPIAAAVITGGLILVTDKSEFRNAAFLVYILFTSWIQWVNLGWPIAVIMLLSGWVSGLILLLSERQQGANASQLNLGVLPGGNSDDGLSGVLRDQAPYPEHESLPSGLFLRVTAFAAACLSAYSLGTSRMFAVYGVPQVAAITGSMLGIIGLLQMSLSIQAHRLGQGMLMLITGFEIIFLSMESAMAIQFLLVLVKLMIAIVMSALGDVPLPNGIHRSNR